MTDKPVKGDKFWRGAALIVLCGLVYYFSWDHGRQSLQPRLDSLRRQAEELVEEQRREILRLQAALADCESRASLQPHPPPSHERLTLKVNQSRILFEGRLVVTVLRVESAEGWAGVQLNFIDQARVVTERVRAGGSLQFDLDGRKWAVVVGSLTLSTANLNLVELKNPTD